MKSIFVLTLLLISISTISSEKEMLSKKSEQTSIARSKRNIRRQLNPQLMPRPNLSRPAVAQPSNADQSAEVAQVLVAGQNAVATELAALIAEEKNIQKLSNSQIDETLIAQLDEKFPEFKTCKKELKPTLARITLCIKIEKATENGNIELHKRYAIKKHILKKSLLNNHEGAEQVSPHSLTSEFAEVAESSNIQNSDNDEPAV